MVNDASERINELSQWIEIWEFEEAQNYSDGVDPMTGVVERRFGADVVDDDEPISFTQILTGQTAVLLLPC